MAMTQCSRHGEASVGFVSPELLSLFLGGKRAPARILNLRLEVEPGLHSNHPIDAEFAKKVASTYGLQGALLLVPVGEPSFEVFCDLRPICSECLVEWLPVQDEGDTLTDGGVPQ